MTKRPTPSDAELLAPSGERGFALLVVLWVVASAALMVSSFNATVRGGASLTTSELGLSQMDAIADAGIEVAVARLMDEELERRWLADGEAHSMSFGGVDLVIRIDDPNGLIDLNKAAGPLLLQFFSHFNGAGSDAEQMRDQILLAREESSNRAAKRQRDTRTKGAMKDEQPSSVLPTEIPRTVAFLDINQLRHLDGMTPQLFSAIAPFVTVYAKDSRVHAEAAPRGLLNAIAAGDTVTNGRQQQNSLSGATSLPTAIGQPRQQSGTQERAIASGPAYIVTVEVQRPNGTLHMGRRAVVILGLDSDAPYRIVSLQTLTGARRIKP